MRIGYLYRDSNLDRDSNYFVLSCYSGCNTRIRPGEIIQSVTGRHA